MTITITIPDAAPAILAAYLLVGLLAYVPLNHWAAHFISPRRRGLEVWKDASLGRILTGILASMVFWPLLLRLVLRDEWRYGLGKRWRYSRCGGCCSTCHGTGVSNDRETNGRCWDCYGSGHVHR
jgi:hypothetical protein